VERVLADGSSSDPTFGTNGLAEANFNAPGGELPEATALDSSGRIVVAGQYYFGGYTQRFGVARFLGASTTTTTALAVPAMPSPPTAAAPDAILGALVLDDPTFLDSLPSGKHRRSN
jgi:hypothetical protein